MTYIEASASASASPGTAGSRDWGKSKDEEMAARGLARQSRKVYLGGEYVLRALALAGQKQPEAPVDVLMEAVWQKLAMDGWPDSVSAPGDPSIRVNLYHSAAGRDVAPLVGSTSLRSPEATAREVLLTVMQELDISASPVLDSSARPGLASSEVPTAAVGGPLSLVGQDAIETAPVLMGPQELHRPDSRPDTVRSALQENPPSPPLPPGSPDIAVPLSPVAQSLAKIYAPVPPDASAAGPPLVAIRDGGGKAGTVASQPEPDERSEEAATSEGWRPRLASLLSQRGAGRPASSRLSLPAAVTIGATLLLLAGALAWMIVAGPGDAASTAPATGQSLAADELTISAPAKAGPEETATPAPWDRPQPLASQIVSAATAAPTENPPESAAGELGAISVPPPASERSGKTGMAGAAAPPSLPLPALSDRLSGQQPEAGGAGKVTAVIDDLPSPPASPQALPNLGEEATLLRAELAAARAQAEKLARDQAEIRSLLKKQTELIARLQSKQPLASGASSGPTSLVSEPVPAAAVPSEMLPAKAITFGPGGTSDLGRIATVADGRRWASVIPGERLADLARRAERSVEDLRTWNAELGHVTPEMRLESGSVWIDPPRSLR